MLAFGGSRIAHDRLQLCARNRTAWGLWLRSLWNITMRATVHKFDELEQVRALCLEAPYSFADQMDALCVGIRLALA